MFGFLAQFNCSRFSFFITYLETLKLHNLGFEVFYSMLSQQVICIWMRLVHYLSQKSESKKKQNDISNRELHITSDTAVCEGCITCELHFINGHQIKHKSRKLKKKKVSKYTVGSRNILCWPATESYVCIFSFLALFNHHKKGSNQEWSRNADINYSFSKHTNLPQ